MMSDTLDRETTGFCSDDDIEAEDGIHSPTDASEDSVDVKVQAISLRNKNKRKSAEPRRVDTDLPAKKRKIDLSVTVAASTTTAVSPVTTKDETRNCSPFRPWSASPTHHRLAPDERYHHRARDFAEDLSRVTMQDEPLSLVAKKRDVAVTWSSAEQTKDASKCTVINRVRKTCPDVKKTSKSSSTASSVGSECATKVSKSPMEDTHSSDNKFRIDAILSSSSSSTSSSASSTRADPRLTNPASASGAATTTSTTTTTASGKTSQGGQQRNYKNMTRERRIEANARERTRVHTISAAFDTLRHSIPAYSNNQKLSKLSVLRIACSYIMTLSRLAGYDYSKDQSRPEIASCVENVSKTIQIEGKIRKKKDD